MPLKFFDEPNINQDAYLNQLGSVLHIPGAAAAVVALHVGTQQYLNLIQRDGMATHRTKLGELRQLRSNWQRTADKLQADISKIEATPVEEFKNHMNREHEELSKELATANQQCDNFRQADERLTVALIHAMQKGMSETPSNMTNQVQVSVLPAGVTVIDNHPSRAVQTVERDTDDEIVRTVTVYERDASTV